MVRLLKIVALSRHPTVTLNEIRYVAVSPCFVNRLLLGSGSCGSGHLDIQLLVRHFLGSYRHILNLGEWLFHTGGALNRRVLNKNGIIIGVFVPVLRQASVKRKALALVFGAYDNLGRVLYRVLDAAESRITLFKIPPLLRLGL